MDEKKEPLSFSYDAATDVLSVEGIRFSGDLFRNFGRRMPINTPFVITYRKDGALIVIRQGGSDS